MKVCSKHGLYLAGTKCQPCYQQDNAGRAHKQRAAGRTTAHWQRLKRLAKEAAGYRCQACGRPEQPTPAGWLDVHLRNRTRSHNDPALTTADLFVTCKSCHGSHHAPEAIPPRGASWDRG
jgi:hypothetical protein